MGKINLDLAAMYPDTFGDKDALRRAAIAEQLQTAQLNAYTQNQQEKDVIRSNQVLPFEDFKIDVNGEQIPFKALPPEQKTQWAKQRQVDWELEQSRKFTKHQADMAKAEVELETNLQKKRDIQASQAGGNVKPGPDFLPGAFFGKPYAQQQKDIEQKIIETEQKRNAAGIQMQALKDTQMPQSYGIPPATKPAPQQQAVQPQAQPQPQGQQSVPTYESRDKAFQGGAKVGDIVYIPGVGKVRLR